MQIFERIKLQYLLWLSFLVAVWITCCTWKYQLKTSFWCTHQKFVIHISLSLTVKKLWEKCTNVARLNYKYFWNIMGSWKLQNVVLNFWHSENWFWNFENFSFVHSRIVAGSVSWYLISLKGIVNWKLLTDILKIFELPATHERKNLNSYKGI